MDETLKTAYNTIKRKRYTHHFCENIAFTTAQEKYMIKVIKGGLELPTAVIDHVSDGVCNERFHILNEEYGCSCGYIIKKTEHHDHLRCTEDHMINNDLKCYHGNVYFPVDLWQNPFGEFQPEEIPNKKNVEKFYEIMKEKRNTFLKSEVPASDMCKYTTYSDRYLIKLITEDADITEEIMNHVADRCDLNIHTLDERFLCAYGFVIKRSELPPTHDFRRCDRDHMISNVLLCRKGEIEYSNEEYKKYASGRPLFFYQCNDFFSLRDYQLDTISNLNWQRRRRKDMMDRSKLKKNHERKPYERPTDTELPQEEYLSQLLRDGQNIPIEITSHVIYGCDIKAHLLDENYGCCYGYILTKEEFLSHDFSKCNSKHKINRRLQCFRGTIEILSIHKNSEIFVGKPMKPIPPMPLHCTSTCIGNTPTMSRNRMKFNKRAQAAPLIKPNLLDDVEDYRITIVPHEPPEHHEYMKAAPLEQPNLPEDEEDYPRIIVPAPPPPDHLD